jgi:hypothetical protein
MYHQNRPWSHSAEQAIGLSQDDIEHFLVRPHAQSNDVACLTKRAWRCAGNHGISKQAIKRSRPSRPQHEMQTRRSDPPGDWSTHITQSDKSAYG